jgi:hypothetical protein
VTDIQPPGPPPAEPPSAPPQAQWQQPGWAQPSYGAQPQWGQQQWGAPPFTPPKKTNGLAIASLICGLGWVVMWPLAFFTGIAAVITGHISRKQIRERDEGGAGLALAGVILGYISIVISILAAIGLVIVFLAVIPAVIENDVRDDAQSFGEAAVIATIEDRAASPRDVERLRRVYFQETGGYTYGEGRGGYYGCCYDDEIRLPDGTSLQIATAADWKRNDWQVEVEQTYLGDKTACVTIPKTTSERVVATKGRCSS